MPWVSLVNLVAEREVVPEILQEEVTRAAARRGGWRRCSIRRHPATRAQREGLAVGARSASERPVPPIASPTSPPHCSPHEDPALARGRSASSRDRSSPLLARTWRFELPPDCELEAAVRAGTAAVVLACWHEELLPLLWHGRGIGMGVVVSGSRDGEYAAQVAEGFGYRALRGSSSRRGAKVLLEAVRELQAGTSVTFTPDGPRGPRRVFKPGAALAAQRAGVPLVPIRATPVQAWRLRSWDQFAIPKPGLAGPRRLWRSHPGGPGFGGRFGGRRRWPSGH